MFLNHLMQKNCLVVLKCSLVFVTQTAHFLSKVGIFMTQRKTKIVCTLNSSHTDINFIKSLIQSGMDTVRLNFSHMNAEAASILLKVIHKIRNEMMIPLSVLLDTKGPEVRVYGFSDK